MPRQTGVNFIGISTYFTMKNIQNSNVNTVILNSVSNLRKAIDFIKSHAKVYTYLDNDEAGKKATQQINRLSCTHNYIHIDKSTEYTKYKDLNEYLCNAHQAQKTEPTKMERKPSRGFKM